MRDPHSQFCKNKTDKATSRPLRISFLNHIGEIPAAHWNRLTGTDYPFLRHEFFAALEESGSVTARSGWAPCHILLQYGTEPVAVMPLYKKNHSFGEFVFDWAWADAFAQNRLAYYPKLLTAIPFTPAQGPRCGGDSELQYPQRIAALREAAIELARTSNYSSWHLLFASAEEMQHPEDHDLLRRTSIAFLWHNRQYSDFTDFLNRLTARRRKSILRERRQLREKGISVRTLSGAEASTRDWDFFYRCYQNTYAKHSGHGGYLNRDFFLRLGRDMGEQTVLFLAGYEDRLAAAALCMRSADTLYGRYWGCLEEELDALHFETCYYQGMEYCIRERLAHFDPGVQGTHKILRGCEPTLSFSCHWFANPHFRSAVSDWLDQEEQEIQNYLHQARALLPFKKTEL